MVGFRLRYVRNYYRQSKLRKIFSWTVQIAIVIAVAFFCAWFFGQRVVITEESMSPTLQTGDKVLINELAYVLSEPRRGDLIVYQNGSDPDSGLQIRRVIGLPEETVQIRDGQILIDGVTYQEDGEFARITNPGIAEDPVELGSEEYFVLGDNRNNSEDSRYADVGTIEKGQIAGKLWFRYGPASRLGFIH